MTTTNSFTGSGNLTPLNEKNQMLIFTRPPYSIWIHSPPKVMLLADYFYEGFINEESIAIASMLSL